MVAAGRISIPLPAATQMKECRRVAVLTLLCVWAWRTSPGGRTSWRACGCRFARLDIRLGVTDDKALKPLAPEALKNTNWSD
jgi:hypothetical protein